MPLIYPAINGLMLAINTPTHEEIAIEAEREWITAGKPEGIDPQTGLEVSVAIWLHAESVLTALMNPTPEIPSYEVR